MKIKNILYVIISLIINVSCAPKDDIRGIFVDKTWKMSNICECKNMKDDGKPTLSQEEVDFVNSNYFTITFKESTFTGRASNATFSGTWSAQDKNNSFSIYIDKINGTENSAIGLQFISLLQNSKFYVGDYLALKLYNGECNKYLLFRPSN